jgi:hypothetical protein|tara:strand:+ start:1839 stop:2018 length:180 start_codon:yes stop_codon:yes gene_type:complete
MQVLIEVKNNYGNTLYYPACINACKFAQIAATKTLSVQILKYIKELGYTITVKQEEVIV